MAQVVDSLLSTLGTAEAIFPSERKCSGQKSIVEMQVQELTFFKPVHVGLEC